MNHCAHNLVLFWMVATTLHLPFPVCDGDDLKSIESTSLCACEAVASTAEIDIDFVLLGCDQPDDVDDGPLDDDPEQDTGFQGAFPVFLQVRAGTLPRTHHACGTVSPWDAGIRTTAWGEYFLDFHCEPSLLSLSGRWHSQAGLSVIRC